MTLAWTALEKFAGHPPLDSVLDFLHNIYTAGGHFAPGRQNNDGKSRESSEREMDGKTSCEISK